MKSGEPVDQQTAVRGRSEDELVFVAVGCWGGPDPVRHTIERFSPFR